MVPLLFNMLILPALPMPPAAPVMMPVLIRVLIVALLLVPTPTLPVPEIKPSLVMVPIVIEPDGVRFPAKTPLSPIIVPVAVLCSVVMLLPLSL